MNGIRISIVTYTAVSALLAVTAACAKGTVGGAPAPSLPAPDAISRQVAAYKGRGAELVSTKKLAPAIVELTKAIKLAPKTVSLYRLRAHCYEATQQHELAIADFTKLMSLSADEPLVLYERSQQYMRLGRPDLAQKDRAAIVKLHHNPEAFDALRKANSYSARGQVDEAMPYFQRAIDLDKSCGAYIARSYQHYEQSDFVKMEQDCTEQIKLGTLLPSAYAMRARARACNYKYKDMLRDLDMVQKLDPQGSADYFMNTNNNLPFDEYILEQRATAYCALGEFNKALTELDRILVKRPAPLIRKQRARINERIGQYDRAIEDYTKLLKDTPEERDGYMARAALYRKVKKFEFALNDYNAFADSVDFDDEFLKERADTYLALNKYNEAIADYSKAISLNQKHAERSYEGRAHVYDLAGKKDLAARDRQKAKELRGLKAEEGLYPK